MLIPLGMLVYMLVAGYSPSLAGGVGVISALVICQFRKNHPSKPGGNP